MSDYFEPYKPWVYYRTQFNIKFLCVGLNHADQQTYFPFVACGYFDNEA